jgi:hypothetical protein
VIFCAGTDVGESPAAQLTQMSQRAAKPRLVTFVVRMGKELPSHDLSGLAAIIIKKT